MVNKLKIVVDDQIPWVNELFASHHLVKKRGEDIQVDDLKDADMLWVRTVTRVGPSLLQKSRVRFVGTATAGYDHLDIDWLKQNGITWAYAPGANAAAVAEYVLCVLAALRRAGKLPARVKAAVIGIGHVGTLIAKSLHFLGFEVLVNDPPKTMESAFISTPLTELKNLDLICLHPSLTRTGAYPSYHLLDDAFLKQQNPGTVLLNAARGAVLDTQVLLRQQHLCLCLDVWEHEPKISLELLKKTVIATPHIAGYSLGAKKKASLLLYQQAQKFFGLPDHQLLKPHDEIIQIPEDWESKALKIFNPLKYTKTMKKFLLEKPEEVEKQFLLLRKNYQLRKSLFSVLNRK